MSPGRAARRHPARGGAERAGPGSAWTERDLLHQMLRIRRFEERCVELYSREEIRGFLHLGIGQEACAVGVVAALGADDAIVATYREHAQALARGIPMRAVMAELMGRAEGCSGGRGGSMHLFDASTRFFGGNAIVGGGLPLAAGLALADSMRSRDRVTVCFFGDGATAEGVFHETMNLAALWHLPVLFACENNRYAMGTAIARAKAETDLALEAARYRMPAWSVDGMDVHAVRRAAEAAVAAVAAGGGPHFLELRTYRFRAHSMYDPEHYRDKAEVEQWRQRDPIPALQQALLASGSLAPSDVDELQARVDAEVDDAVAFAAAGTLEPIETLYRHVTAAPSPTAPGGPAAAGTVPAPSPSPSPVAGADGAPGAARSPSTGPASAPPAPAPRR